MVQQGFACVCLVKSVELGTDHKLHRALKEQELHSELDRVPAATASAYLPCGGIRAVKGTHEISCAVVGHTTGVVEGHFDNYDELAATYLKKTSNGSPAPSATEDSKMAELLCTMFEAEGLEILKKLRGTFSLCVYDSKLVRVFAVREHGGKVPLFQGRTAKDNLIISSNRAFLTDCHDIVEFHAGESKYGWHAAPRKYPKPEGGQKKNGAHNPKAPKKEHADNGHHVEHDSEAHGHKGGKKGHGRGAGHANGSANGAAAGAPQRSAPTAASAQSAAAAAAFAFNVNAPAFVPGSVKPATDAAPGQQQEGAEAQKKGRGHSGRRRSCDHNDLQPPQPGASTNSSSHNRRRRHSHDHHRSSSEQQAKEGQQQAGAKEQAAKDDSHQPQQHKNERGRRNSGSHSRTVVSTPPSQQVWVPKQPMTGSSDAAPAEAVVAEVTDAVAALQTDGADAAPTLLGACAAVLAECEETIAEAAEEEERAADGEQAAVRPGVCASHPLMSLEVTASDDVDD